MIFWTLLTAGLIALAAFLAGPPTEALLTDDEMRAVYLTVLLTGLIAGGAGRAILYGRWRPILHGLAWMGIFATLLVGYAFRYELRYVYDRVRGELQPTLALSTTGDEVELRRAWDGHFRAGALVNGAEIELMVDTGASVVVIPFEEAEAIGIDTRRLTFSVPVNTANGRSAVAPHKLDEIKIGTITVTDVPAAIAQPGRLKVGLLGMSFLDRLSETSFQRDRLILRQQSTISSLFRPAPQFR